MSIGLAILGVHVGTQRPAATNQLVLDTLDDLRRVTRLCPAELVGRLTKQPAQNCQIVVVAQCVGQTFQRALGGLQRTGRQGGQQLSVVPTVLHPLSPLVQPLGGWIVERLSKGRARQSVVDRGTVDRCAQIVAELPVIDIVAEPLQEGRCLSETRVDRSRILLDVGPGSQGSPDVIQSVCRHPVAARSEHYIECCQYRVRIT